MRVFMLLRRASKNGDGKGERQRMSYDLVARNGAQYVDPLLLNKVWSVRTFEDKSAQSAKFPKPDQCRIF